MTYGQNIWGYPGLISNQPDNFPNDGPFDALAWTDDNVLILTVQGGPVGAAFEDTGGSDWTQGYANVAVYNVNLAGPLRGKPVGRTITFS